MKRLGYDDGNSHYSEIYSCSFTRIEAYLEKFEIDWLNLIVTYNIIIGCSVEQWICVQPCINLNTFQVFQEQFGQEV